MKKLTGTLHTVDPLGRILCLIVLLLPLVRLLLHPNTGLINNFQIYAVHVTVAELLFVAGYILTRREQGYRFDMIPPLLWVAFAIWTLVSLYTLGSAADPDSAIHKYTQYTVHFIFAVTLVSYLNKRPETAGPLLVSIILSAFVMLPLFFLALYGLAHTPGFHWSSSLPGFSNVRHLDYFLAIALVGLNLMPAANKRLLEKRHLPELLILGLAILWLLLCWTGARGSILAALAALAVCFVLQRNESQIKKILLISLLALVAGALLSLLLPNPNGSYGLLRFASTVTDATDINSFSSNRVAIWKDALNIWQSYPWFGAGAGQTRAIVDAAHNQFVHPHNVIIQALMAWGVIGGICFLGVIVGALWAGARRMTKKAETNPAAIGGLGMMFTVAANAMIDGTLYHPFPFFLFLIGAGLALAPPVKAG